MQLTPCVELLDLILFPTHYYLILKTGFLRPLKGKQDFFVVCCYSVTDEDVTFKSCTLAMLF